MMNQGHYTGQVLDEKYRLERLLGQGGMGEVYLATHLGTERYVALKLIMPQFMRNEEFVARFKREARAAGRLRHPNVVDVTDFGFAQADGEPVAYLVMEYLDGCTLGDILAEESKLPVEWVVDILEQVCSAVNEAHQQGVVHRDLKPENIWLEPNRLGGYRVKVLDFGIAKVAPGIPEGTAINSASAPTLTSPEDLECDTLLYPSGNAVANEDQAITQQVENRKTQVGQAAEEESTQLFAQAAATSHALPGPETKIPDDEGRTLTFDQRQTVAKQATALFAHTTQASDLTRVGAIMGTPLYMSPEQCAGQTLDARSDIYSLGVIAYQMLTGETPFAGDTSSVMREHLKSSPPPLRGKSRKVPKRIAETVMTALSKDPAQRPQTAAAFASALRAQADGISSLYRRAIALYSEHFPTFFKLSLIAHIPLIITTLMLVGFALAEESVESGSLPVKVCFYVALGCVFLLQLASYFVAASVISGVTAILVTQLTVAPLRPVDLRAAFAVLRQRWRPFLNTAIRVTIRIIIGTVLCVIPGMVMSVRYSLFAPVVLLEGLEKKAALQRARSLASRSWRTVIIVVVLQFLIPSVVSAITGRLAVSASPAGEPRSGVKIDGGVSQQLLGLINIFIVPLMSIVPALLYLKMRQLGGESLSAALDKIDAGDEELSKWQKRMRTRLSLHTPRSNTPRNT